MNFADGDKMEHVCNTMACMEAKVGVFLADFGYAVKVGDTWVPIGPSLRYL